MFRLLTAALALCLLSCVEVEAQKAAPPQYVVEPFWPKPLPGNWILGQAAGVAVDNDDSVWIIHRPSTLVDDEKGAQKNPPETRCCQAAPPVLHFAADGSLLHSWGGPGAGYDWPNSEHGIHIDKEGNVWLAGNGKDDHQLLKFSRDGKFLQQIGKAGATGGSNSKTELGRPAHMVTDEAAGELYVADGYLNRRIVVFDLNTGAYKRHWGAYGMKEPNDDKLPPYTPAAIGALSKSFANPVHCVRLSGDGLLYVCDRANNRIQVFQEGRHLCEGVPGRAADAAERRRLGPGTVGGQRPALHLRCRRGQHENHARSPERREARELRSPRPHGGRIQVGAQHGDRFPRQPLYHRGRHGQARTKVQARGWANQLIDDGGPPGVASQRWPRVSG